MLVAQSYLTVCDPTDWYLPDSCVHGIVQARIVEWAAISFSIKTQFKQLLTHTLNEEIRA